MLQTAGSQGLWRNYRNRNKSEICQTGAVSADIWRLLLPGQSKSLFYYLFLVNSQKYTILMRYPRTIVFHKKIICLRNEKNLACSSFLLFLK